MKRRDAIKMLGAAAGGALRLPAQTPAPPDPEVKRVLVMFKCHLDVGFTDTQAGVMRKYFDVYYPEAIKRAAAMRQAGPDRFVWTTGSWMLYEFLEQAGAADRARMEKAIADGDIAWHALPFSWQTELLDRSLIRGGLAFSQALDRRFGKRTTGCKMTDVPGHTIGLVQPLAEAGVKFLHIGVNSASTPPQVPSQFVWKEPGGATLIVMYQHKGYGGVQRVPGSDLAICVEMGDDNTGPQTLDEIRAAWANLRRQFPNAKITAGGLTEIANAMDAYRAKLPVVTEEIGDTWIHGVPSDPVKLAKYREMARVRRAWIDRGQMKAGDATDLAFLRRFLLAVEHTWGTDTKTYLDHDHYTPADLQKMLPAPGYRKMIVSWKEKRDNLDTAIAALPEKMRGEMTARVAALAPREPVTGMKEFDPSRELDGAHFTIALDPKTGALRRLRSKASGREWASAENPLALFSYQTFSAEDYARFMDSYVTSKADWAPQDFGKPNIAKFGARHGDWTARLLRAWSASAADGDRLTAQLEIADQAGEKSGVVAWPKRMYLHVFLPKASAAADLTFSCFGKVANRLPEALWLTFRPAAPAARGWNLEKSGVVISPRQVVRGGNRHMHALGRGILYRDEKESLAIDALDAPVVALGVKSPIYFSLDPPDLSQGLHFSLYNNGWGTNYIQWFGEDTRYRFRITEPRR